MLCRAPDDERLDSFETCRADKNCEIKIDYKNCANRWLQTVCYLDDCYSNCINTGLKE